MVMELDMGPVLRVPVNRQEIIQVSPYRLRTYVCQPLDRDGPVRPDDALILRVVPIVLELPV